MLECWNVISGVDLRRIKPDREIEVRTADVLPERIELGDSETARAFDPVLLCRADELAGVTSHEKEPGRSELARDKAREIGAHGWEMARLHGSTL